MANPPLITNTHPGSADSATAEKIAAEGARTIPGRPEHGGNCDIKNLSRGSKVYLPVHVPGAKFSVGDLHFSRKYLSNSLSMPDRSCITNQGTEGDGEISFCGAIEMAGVITIKFTVIPNGQKQLGMINGRSPIFIPGPVQPQFGPGRMLYFEVRTSIFNLVQVNQPLTTPHMPGLLRG